MNIKRLGIVAVVALALAALALPALGPVDKVQAVNVGFTNTTGQPASYFVLIASIGTVPATVVTQPAGCGTPQKFGGFEYVELIWPTACIGAGESITLDTVDPGCCIVYSGSFAASPPAVSALNNKGFTADKLTIDTSTTGLTGALLVQNAPGCPPPTLDEQPPSQVTLVWSSLCVDPGEKVSVHVAGPGGGGANIPSLPTQFSLTSVGGIAELSEADAALIEAHEPSRYNTGVIAGITAASAAVVVLGGAAWYTRRRMAG